MVCHSWVHAYFTVLIPAEGWLAVKLEQSRAGNGREFSIWGIVPCVFCGIREAIFPTFCSSAVVPVQVFVQQGCNAAGKGAVEAQELLPGSITQLRLAVTPR